MDSSAVQSPKQRQFPCKTCGANLEFAPGTTALKCPYCGAMNEIEAPEGAGEAVEEKDYLAFLGECEKSAECTERLAVKCGNCGAETTLRADTTAARCPFCGAGIVAEASSRKLIRAQAVLPFGVTREQAGEAFRKWIASRWFAPSELRKRAEESRIDGVYIPYWTYDAHASSSYTGERGDNYWTTETYTATENGRSVTRTRQVQKIRWWPVSGRVANDFDDVLVLASRSLPKGYAESLEPWDLEKLTPYRDEYLSGFVSESYQVGLAEGFETAKGLMAPEIRATVLRHIGGDHQRVHSVNSRYSEITFKHVLLPIWLSAYRYGEKTFRFLVNARTGEVQGERPYSAMKIILTIVAILLAIVMGVVIANVR